MAAQKKRKIEGANETESPVLSAFAARQKLWGPALTEAIEKPETAPQPLPQSQRHLSENSGRLEPPPKPIPRRITRSQVAQDLPSPSPDAQPEDTPPLAPVSPKARTVIQHSTFRPNKKNYRQKPDGCVLLKLAEGERLVILGSYGLKICEGELTVSGAVLQSSPTLHWMHSPSCHALPVIRTVSDATVEIHPHRGAQGLRLLSRLNPAFGKLWHEYSSQTGASSKATFRIVFTSDDGPKRVLLQELAAPAEWNKKLAGTVAAKLKCSTPIIFLCGPKSSGKSTFGKLLLNRLVTDQGNSKKAWTAVAVLDLDPGQPEYTPPGVISLNRITSPNLAAPFCHPVLEPAKEQPRAHAIAAVTPAQDPAHYIESVLNLLSHYRTNLDPKCPLIINTPGWIQGTGLDILVELVEKIRPTEVVYMSQDGPEETVESLKSACGNVIPLSTLPSQTGSGTSRTPLEFRTMQTLSYFHLNWSSLCSPTPTWDPTPLTALRPWRVRYRGPDPGFIGILCYDHQPGPGLLAEATNGMILALVKIESRSAFRDLLVTEFYNMEVDGGASAPSTKGIISTPEGIPLIQNSQGRTLDPRYSRALGLVLVRGIDTQRGELQILTPLPSDVIAEAGKDIVLVAGKFDTPSWAYSEDLYLRAFTSAKGEDSGAATLARDSGSESGSEEDSGEERPAEEVRAAMAEQAEVPWVEMLHGGQKRSVGSKVWRVRRDLGRS